MESDGRRSRRGRTWLLYGVAVGVVFVTVYILATFDPYHFRIVHTFSEILPIVEEARKEGEVTVWFCIEEVLTRPESPLLTKEDISTHWVWREETRGLTMDQVKTLRMAMAVAFPQTLIDKDAPDIIRKIQARGVSCHGLSPLVTGPFDSVPSLENWELQELARLGITFSPLPEWQCSAIVITIYFHLMGLLQRPFHTKGGVLFTCVGRSDGSRCSGPKLFVALEFWKSYLSAFSTEPPKTIVLVSSQRDGLLAAMSRLQQKHIKNRFVGILYSSSNRQEDLIRDPEEFRRLIKESILKTLKEEALPAKRC